MCVFFFSFQLKAIDLDAGRNGQIDYEFENNTGTALERSGLFGIGRKSGKIIVREKLDFEVQSIFVLTVVAVDNGDERLESSTTVIVRIKDVNDNHPRIVSHGGREANISGSSDPGTFVHHMTVDDPDSGLNGDVVCSVNNDRFSLIEIYPKEYKIVTARSGLDRGLDRGQAWIEAKIAAWIEAKIAA